LSVDIHQKYLELQRLQAERDRQYNLPHLYGLKFYKWQRLFWNSVNRMNMLTAANQIGKMLPNDSEVPTPQGFKKVGDIQVGDQLIGEDGKPTNVIAIPYKGVRPCYLITFDDGAQIVAGKEHLWKCQTEKNRFRPEYTCNRGEKKGQKIPNPDYGKWQVLETQEILKCGGYEGGTPRTGKKVVIPVCSPVQYCEKSVPIDPYVLGAFIGDGQGTRGCFGCGDPEMTKRVIPSDQEIKWDAKKKGYSYGYLGYETYQAIKDLKLDVTAAYKHIPSIYLTASFEQRLELLKGLMDTDGSIYGSNTLEYCTISDQLKDNFIELVNSLGGIVNKVTLKDTWYYNDNRERVKCSPAYSIRFKIQHNPFWLERKANKWRKEIRYRHQRIIESIEFVGDKEGTCFTVDSEDSTFLAGREYIVNHNSSINIKKCIHWATHKRLWKALWPLKIRDELVDIPNMFWYLYPDKNTATQEFHEKWVREFLPRNDMKDDPVYGWQAHFEKRKIEKVTFNSGVTIYFKTYNQDPQNLQSGTVYAIFCDEELPFTLYDELKMRLSNTEGYFHMVFTATLNQLEWRQAMELKGNKERFPNAFKQQISLYDCMKYEDGTPSPWTKERIQSRIDDCGSKAEVQRRIFGKFVNESGRKYSTFDVDTHTVDPYVVPRDWTYLVGVDIGSGGKTGHPSAIVFVAVAPDFSKGVVEFGWKGDGVVTTAGDVVQKVSDMIMEYELQGRIYNIYYDWQSTDFNTISERVGLVVTKAYKSHTAGEGVVNSLFKYDALKIMAKPELWALGEELLTVPANVIKGKKDDDYCDALRYGVTSAPWHWENIKPPKFKPKKAVFDPVADEIARRRGEMYCPEDEEVVNMDNEIYQEMQLWNEMLGT